MNLKVKNRTFKVISFFITVFFLSNISAQNKPCNFDQKILQFVGKPTEQAKCLLRTVKIYGKVDDKPLAKLPKPIDKLIGATVKVTLLNLTRKYINTKQIEETAFGGSLNSKLSEATLPNSTKINALYFMIHDTSTPNYGDKDFPADINESIWKFNNLDYWEKQKVAHVFVNRLGESVTAVDFGSVLPDKHYGTKFARDFLKQEAKGLQIHIELSQPRKKDIGLGNDNDAIAPISGFTDKQYERLALLYVCASVRRGTWLIPAFHAPMDAGIKDAHDDPQNFDLGRFCLMLGKLLTAIDRERLHVL